MSKKEEENIETKEAELSIKKSYSLYKAKHTRSFRYWNYHTQILKY